MPRMRELENCPGFINCNIRCPTPSCPFEKSKAHNEFEPRAINILKEGKMKQSDQHDKG